METPETVPPALLLAGYEQACERFYAAMNGNDSAATFIPLFEALGWVFSIDEGFKRLWKAEPRSLESWSDGFIHGDTVKGVRYARGRVHHQWAEALWLSPGAQLPRTLPFMLGEWRWRPKLPGSRSVEYGEAEYDQHVAAVPARVTLGELSLCFAHALPALAP
jgi:hypothetical protein